MSSHASTVNGSSVGELASNYNGFSDNFHFQFTNEFFVVLDCNPERTWEEIEIPVPWGHVAGKNHQETGSNVIKI